MKKHLAIFSPDTAERVLNGQKTIEIRFSKAKVSPYEQVSSNDLVYIKPSGKDIIGQFRVNKVITFDALDKQDIINIQKIYQKQISLDETDWQFKKNMKYGTLIFIGECTRFITSPIKIPKKDNRTWVVLD